jgi:hypothetical protein
MRVKSEVVLLIIFHPNFVPREKSDFAQKSDFFNQVMVKFRMEQKSGDKN